MKVQLRFIEGLMKAQGLNDTKGGCCPCIRAGEEPLQREMDEQWLVEG